MKNITLNQRAMIKVLLEQNLSQLQIAKKLKLSWCSVQNAIKHINNFGMLENAPRTRRNRNTTETIDGTIRRQCEDNRQLIARDIHDEVKAYPECSLSVMPIRQPQNKIFVSFEELEGPSCTSADYTKVVFSDESKFNRFGSDGKKYVRRRPGEEFMPKYTIPTIKHGGGSVMVWAAFNRNGPGPHHIVEGIMDSTSYVRILENNLLPYARSQRFGRNWIFQQDNDAKHSMAIPESRLESHRTPMERCRKGGTETKPSTIKTLEAVIKKDWAQISVERCVNFVDSMPRRCATVIENFGYPTKY
uniref:HTH_Tnp_Tc3_2 domain-containing protein n=1 Tax=Heterorhabditis bacteriophora TaxID=37862 RepID=A0A1I7XAG9_HETBA